MSKVCIFISHSTPSAAGGGGDENEQFLQTVHAALQADPRFDPRLDRADLRLADNWKQTLFRWLDEAHGAVIMLSNSALGSVWVSIEASILAYKKHRNKQFPVCLILLDGVTAESLKSGYLKELNFDEIQCINSVVGVGATTEKVKEVFASVHDELARPRTPREKFMANAIKRFKETEMDACCIYSVCNEVIGYHNVQDLNGVAEIILGIGRSDRIEHFEKICKFIVRMDGEYSGEYRNGLLKIFDLTVPVWVDESHVSPIAGSYFYPRQTKRIFCLDVEYIDTAKTYVNRSRFREWNDENLIFDMPDEILMDEGKDVVEAAKEKIFEFLGYRRSGRSITDDLNRMLNDNFDRHGTRCIVIVKGRTLEINDFDKLCEDLPCIVFILVAPCMQSGDHEHIKNLVAPSRAEEEKIDACIAHVQINLAKGST